MSARRYLPVVSYSLLLASCASARSGSLDAPATPAPTAGPTDAAMTAIADAGAATTETEIAEELHARYGFDVAVVQVPPPAVFLLARRDEPEGVDCQAALLKYARWIGANHLYVDASRPGCHGAVYMVPPQREAADAAATEPTQTMGEYAGELHEWLRARWHRPEGISDSELRKLCVVTRVWTSSQLRIWKVLPKPSRPSGNPSFDESVRLALEAAIDEHAPLPEGRTIEMSRKIRGAMITLAFTLGDPRKCQ